MYLYLCLFVYSAYSMSRHSWDNQHHHSKLKGCCNLCIYNGSLFHMSLEMHTTPPMLPNLRQLEYK